MSVSGKSRSCIRLRPPARPSAAIFRCKAPSILRFGRLNQQGDLCSFGSLNTRAKQNRDILSALRRVGTVLVIATALGTAYYIGHLRGETVGRASAAGWFRSRAFIASLYALENLRKGDQTRAIKHMEGHCFTSAIGLLESKTPYRSSVTSIFRTNLVAYRKTYASPIAEQSWAEKRLDELLRALPQ